MKKCLFFLFLSLSTLLFAQQNTLEVPTIAVKIPLGETVDFKNVSINL